MESNQIIQKSIINSAVYWAEEFIIPLYVLTDRKQAPFVDNVLCLYQDNVIKVYFISGRDKEEAARGAKFFKGNNVVRRYRREVERVLSALESMRSLPHTAAGFRKMLKVNRLWNEAYIKTEAIRLSQFEDEKDPELLERLEEIAELRFKLRVAADSILFKELDSALDDFGKAFGTKPNDIMFYDLEELFSLLQKNITVDKKIIEQRKQGFAFWIDHGDPHLVVGKPYEHIVQMMNAKHKHDESQELRGRSASKGVAKGRVRIIRHNERDISEQIQKFRDGEVLVTEMTRPQTITACRRAVAIVTDEGGVTSHAAIVARELNIPCVIGTQHATKMLHDGMLVEVDADSGRVSIVEKDKNMSEKT